MITTIVSFCRQDAVNDIFKVARIDSLTQESHVEYLSYPKSMNMTETDVYAELEDQE